MNFHRHRPLTIALLGLLFASTVHAEPIPDILEARENFLESAPAQIEPEAVPDLESFLLGLPENPTLALIQQVEGIGNRAEIRQEGGAGDIGVVFQGFGDSNEALIQQTGNGNFAVLSQSGDSNQVLPLEQLGIDNIARLTQVGNNNRAEVHQFDQANELDLRQTDAYNNALVNQFGGTVLDITQNNLEGSPTAVNDLSVSAYLEPGFTSNFGPISLSGPGQTAVTLCSGSPGFCDQFQ